MAGKSIKEFILKHLRYFIVGGLFVLWVILLIIFLVNKKKNLDTDETASVIPETGAVVEVPKDKYELDAYQNVNTLVASYLNAMSVGDTETMASLSSSLSDDKKAFYTAQAKYMGDYSNYHVYTKKGPEENSYFVLVTFDLHLQNQTTALPALLSLYVCTNESGALYVNSESLTADDEAYILELVAQKDFADLIEDVEIQYNAKLDSDSSLAATAEALKEEINRDAQDLLAQQQQEAMEAAAQAEADAQEAAKIAASTQVRCTSENVNIRASASTDATSLGKTTAGEIYTRYEAMDNGWSKIDYNGQEAFIKSEYLEPVDSSGTEAPAEGGTVQAQPGDKITVKENVNVRKSPSETGDKIATAYRGEQYELIENKDGWCKINYKGEEAYVKSDYVE